MGSQHAYMPIEFDARRDVAADAYYGVADTGYGLVERGNADECARTVSGMEGVFSASVVRTVSRERLVAALADLPVTDFRAHFHDGDSLRVISSVDEIPNLAMTVVKEASFQVDGHAVRWRHGGLDVDDAGRDAVCREFLPVVLGDK